MPPNTNSQSNPLRQIADSIGTANNILLTVSNNPSVDQLAACIGLTLALNKQGKHATAVFSGKVPSTLEFLQPEKTIETNTNSLRDFIISLDKSKADKLRYKVEDDYVKIFITPYRTSIDEKDLAFTQGDFNIDLIIMLGIHERNHLDGAIVAHGRILHDATIVAMNTDTASEMGSINWLDDSSSSLCEMASDLVMEVDKSLLDAQIATALLTGMVAETDRFGNEKAHPHTMSISGVLMAAGASPQLISSKLQEPEPEPEPEAPPEEIPAVVDELEDLPKLESVAETAAPEEPAPEEPEKPEEPDTPKNNDGIIQIDHEQDDILIDEHGKLQGVKELEEAQAALEAEVQAAAETEAKARAAELESQPVEPEQPPEALSQVQNTIMTEPPQLGGQLTANSIAEHEQASPSTDPMSATVPSGTPLLERTQRRQVQQPLAPSELPGDQTLTEIEESVGSPHLQYQPSSEPASTFDSDDSSPLPPPLDDARAAVEEAVETDESYRPEPINALGATPVDLDLGHSPLSTSAPIFSDNDEDEDNKTENSGSDNAPPPVPPPLMPPGM